MRRKHSRIFLNFVSLSALLLISNWACADELVELEAKEDDREFKNLMELPQIAKCGCFKNVSKRQLRVTHKATCVKGKNTLGEALSLFLPGCSQIPCKIEQNHNYTFYLEFFVYEDIGSLEIQLGILYHNSDIPAPIKFYSACDTLLFEKKCPFLKYETYILAIELDMNNLVPQLVEEMTTHDWVGFAFQVIDTDKDSGICAQLKAVVR